MAGKIRLRGSVGGFTQIESADSAPENTLILPTEEGGTLATEQFVLDNAGGGALADLDDVDTFGVEDGDTLVYNEDGEGGVWLPAKPAAGAKGAGGDEVFWENDTQISTSYTITTNKNALTAGPIEILSGADVEIPAGSVWTIV
jgi:hypothetical protein